MQKEAVNHYPGMGTFRIAVVITDFDNALFYNESYYTISLVQGQNARDGINIEYSEEILDLEPWEPEIVKQATYGSLESHDAVRCPKYNNYTLSGSYSSEISKFLTFQVLRWSPLRNMTNWASDAEIDGMMNNGRISIIIINSYVDFDDYENVIKTYTDDRLIYGLSGGNHCSIFI